MRKMVFGRHLSRGRKAREALFVSLTRAILSHGKITTTKAKAKSIQGKVEKLIKSAQDTSIASKRRIFAELRNDRKSADSLFTTVAPLFADRKSGFTRVVLLPRRKGDNAEMARIELVQELIKKPIIKEEKKKPVEVKKAESKKKTPVKKTATKK